MLNEYYDNLDAEKFNFCTFAGKPKVDKKDSPINHCIQAFWFGSIHTLKKSKSMQS